MLVFDPGTMWWAARIRNLREKPSPGLEMLRNVWKAFNPTQFESLAGSLAEGLVKRALALGPRGPGRLITEAGNELRDEPSRAALCRLFLGKTEESRATHLAFRQT